MFRVSSISPSCFLSTHFLVQLRQLTCWMEVEEERGIMGKHKSSTGAILIQAHGTMSKGEASNWWVALDKPLNLSVLSFLM